MALSRLSVFVFVFVVVPAIASTAAPGVAHAAAKRSVVVEVSPGGWRAGALVQALTADLADDRLAPRALPGCGGSCPDATLRAAGVELVVRAALADGRDGALAYELRALWPDAPAPVRGSIALRGVDRGGLAALLRDQLHRLARTTGDAADAPAAAATSRVAAGVAAGGWPGPGEIARLWGLVLAVLATPLLLGALRARKLVARPAARRTLIGLASLGALALAITAIGPGNGAGLWFAAGGVAWGALVAVTLPLLVPPLVGVGRIDYRELGAMLALWSALVAQRALLLAVLYVPLACVLVRAPLEVVGEALGAAGSARRLALVLPLGLLVARQWARLAVAVCAELLDGALQDRADAAAWHAATRGYLVGYLQRNGLAVDDDLLERITVVPATGDRVRVYGGGATHTRIAIPRRMLELALAPWGRPHDYAAPRVSTLHWTQWNAGLVMATEAGAPVATREQRQPRETTTQGDPSEHAREPLGEPPTLAGIIEPRALDPRKSYRPHDDPAWLDWDAGEDYDGTDAGDRDFLFGVLVHATALVQRRGDGLSTLALVLARNRLTAPLGRLLARVAEAAGDGHAAIQGARHHLVQYLGWLAWQREELLTARAYAPELEAMSRRVLAERTPPTVPAPEAARARARLARLAGFIADAPVRTRWRTLVIAAAVVAGASGAALAVADAVRYHATYTKPPTETHGKD